MRIKMSDVRKSQIGIYEEAEKYLRELERDFEIVADLFSRRFNLISYKMGRLADLLKYKKL